MVSVVIYVIPKETKPQSVYTLLVYGPDLLLDDHHNTHLYKDFPRNGSNLIIGYSVNHFSQARLYCNRISHRHQLFKCFSRIINVFHIFVVSNIHAT